MKRSAGLLLLALCAWPAVAASKPNGHAIASAHPLATDAGLLVLSVGGNAFDAAVAVSAALAVVEPSGSGLGGGGFWLLRRASDGFEVLVDGREKAPLSADADMYLDKNGNYIEGSSTDGPLAAGIPGEPAALAHIAERYGRLPLAKSLAPAIRYARDGFRVDERMHRMLQARHRALRKSKAATEVFLPGGEIPAPGTIIRQPDLAHTLSLLGDEGADGFYKGDMARALVKGVNKAGGDWSQKDLDRYTVVERTPLTLRYRDTRVITAPPPSAGGMVMGIAFNVLEGFDFRELPPVDRKHLLVEALRRACRDRAAYLGDPEFVATPLQLLSPGYADGMRKSIQMSRATPSIKLPPVNIDMREGNSTTHFSVVDAEGNLVSATLSINLPFGSGFIAPGTGVLLNNEMDDFTIKPGQPNSYGLVGSNANAIAPGKRMSSSMSPSFVERKDRVMAIGTPGGSRIITMVMEGVMGFADGADAKRIVTRPRMHHQYLPDEIVFEKGALTDDDKANLRRRGHALREVEPYGNMQVIIWNRANGRLDAASDPRGIGLAEERAAVRRSETRGEEPAFVQ